MEPKTGRDNTSFINSQERKICSEETARKIGTEVKAIVDQAHEQARQLLCAQQAALERLARRILEREALEGAELQALLPVQSGTTAAASSAKEPLAEI